MGSHHPIRKTVAPEPVAIPDKLYFRIGDVARLCEVAPYVLRFWETEFPQLKPNKGGTGQRLYRKREVETALRIKSLLYHQGYTIPGARQILKGDAPPVALEPVAEIAPKTVQHREPEPFDRGSELRLRAQLADIRDEMQAILSLLGPAKATEAAATETVAKETGIASPVQQPARQLRPRLVLEPKPAARPTLLTGLHLAQGDLFTAE